MIDTAILLAAGRGERLRPLTDHLPKPLIPVGDKALIIYHLEKLAQSGIKNIIINTFYLAEKLQTVLKNGKKFGVKIIYSHETCALETGGGILKALSYFKNPGLPFLVISSDIYTEYNFSQIIQKDFIDLFNHHKLHAHLILVPNPSYHLKGDFCIDNNYSQHTKILNYLTLPSIDKINHHSYTYSGISLLHSNLFKNCKVDTCFKLSILLNQAIIKKKITGEVYGGQWYNIGTLAEYDSLCKQLKLSTRLRNIDGSHLQGIDYD